eukprot:scaffold1188_cov255-Pinguiococcus_pyrenoidosus.AAC.9
MISVWSWLKMLRSKSMASAALFFIPRDQLLDGEFAGHLLRRRKANFHEKGRDDPPALRFWPTAVVPHDGVKEHGLVENHLLALPPSPLQHGVDGLDGGVEFPQSPEVRLLLLAIHGVVRPREAPEVSLGNPSWKVRPSAKKGGLRRVENQAKAYPQIRRLDHSLSSEAQVFHSGSGTIEVHRAIHLRRV